MIKPIQFYKCLNIDINFVAYIIMWDIKIIAKDAIHSTADGLASQINKDHVLLLWKLKNVIEKFSGKF